MALKFTRLRKNLPATTATAMRFFAVDARRHHARGRQNSPICFLKGEVLCVLVCLIDEKTREKYLLLVRQRRICDGSLTYEHPAGMLDSESDAVKVAAKEVFEETGMTVEKIN